MHAENRSKIHLSDLHVQFNAMDAFTRLLFGINSYANTKSEFRNVLAVPCYCFVDPKRAAVPNLRTTVTRERKCNKKESIDRLNFSTADNVCPTNKHRCPNGRCIPVSWVCNYFNDCGDNSDEIHCGKSLYVTVISGVGKKGGQGRHFPLKNF